MSASRFPLYDGTGAAYDPAVVELEKELSLAKGSGFPKVHGPPNGRRDYPEPTSRRDKVLLYDVMQEEVQSLSKYMYDSSEDFGPVLLDGSRCRRVPEGEEYPFFMGKKVRPNRGYPTCHVSEESRRIAPCMTALYAVSFMECISPAL